MGYAIEQPGRRRDAPEAGARCQGNEQKERKGDENLAHGHGSFLSVMGGAVS